MRTCVERGVSASQGRGEPSTRTAGKVNKHRPTAPAAAPARPPLPQRRLSTSRTHADWRACPGLPLPRDPARHQPRNVAPRTHQHPTRIACGSNAPIPSGGSTGAAAGPTRAAGCRSIDPRHRATPRTHPSRGGANAALCAEPGPRSTHPPAQRRSHRRQALRGGAAGVAQRFPPKELRGECGAARPRRLGAGAQRSALVADGPIRRCWHLRRRDTRTWRVGALGASLAAGSTRQRNRRVCCLLAPALLRVPAPAAASDGAP